MRKLLNALKRDERGVSALEYAILAGVIVAAVVAGVGMFGEKIEAGFKNLGDQVDTATQPKK
ncbi:Flp family type IVb pilin [Corticimicrobacter populi]|uniref:Flp family type IVb pilin n=1 Tax=Corticimicrobacter populi TaxID=2175229 RepID=A0A2V1K0Z8_9BURK|nr:Flp family type IVb pilin [Corticimicrobacter populi]PWF24118.1 Flp family type IVb pilin [Corticimicrobacter populi]